MGAPGFLRADAEAAAPPTVRITRTAAARDPTSRIPDTRVLCIPTVAKRGRVRSVALVTTERPVHERAPSRAARAVAQRLRMPISVEVGLLAVMGAGKVRMNVRRAAPRSGRDSPARNLLR